MSKKRQPPMTMDVAIERDGTTYRGSYTVDREVVRVSDGDGSKATQIGNSSPERIARILLSELVEEELTRERSR
jgi:hypothetical protein